MKYECPYCKGRGTVFDKMSLFLTVALPIAWLIDEDDGSGLVRKICPKCSGQGILSDVK